MQTQIKVFVIFSKSNWIHLFYRQCISNPCVETLPRIKISFLLLSIFVDELKSTATIINFLQVPPLGYEKNPFLLNLIPSRIFILSISASLAKLTAPNKRLSCVG